jgi:hypothetical protein
MLLYFITKKSNELNSDTIFITIIKYIFFIAILKFIEHKHNMHGFFNIYISLVIIVDIGFTLYNYIQKYIISINSSKEINNRYTSPLDLTYSTMPIKNNLNPFNIELTSDISFNKSNIDFNIFSDEVINIDFDIKKFNNELKKFNERIKKPLNFESTNLIIQESLGSGQKKIKIIKKEKESETEIKKFNENKLNK